MLFPPEQMVAPPFPEHIRGEDTPNSRAQAPGPYLPTAQQLAQKEWLSSKDTVVLV